MTPYPFQGVADMYRFTGGAPLGEKKPEALDQTRTLQETIRTLAAYLEPKVP